jgi:hypothetical protein
METTALSDGLFWLPDDRNMGVWRYMDLSRLISLLDGRALHFARACDFTDPFEGAVSAASLRSRPARAATEAALVGAHGIPITDKEMQEIYTFTRERMPRQVMVNCWHMGDGESAAMWGLYCPGGFGVAIRSTIAKLIAALPGQIGDSAIKVSAVTYADYDSVRTPDGSHTMAPFLLKRQSFRHEQELRALLIHRDPAPAVLPVPVDLGSFIEAVYVAPQSSGWRRRVTESVLHRYGLDVPVVQSRLDDPALR